MKPDELEKAGLKGSTAKGISIHTSLLKEISKKLKDNSTPKNGCLIWNGNHKNYGYGSVMVMGKQYRVHRLSYAIHKSGGSLECKWLVLHRCNNRACINPEHLYLGNYKDNMHDCVASGNHNYAGKKTCSKGHKYDIFWHKQRYCSVCRMAWRNKTKKKYPYYFRRGRTGERKFEL